MNNEILLDREIRYEIIVSLIKMYQLPVVCGKINYPGENKNTLESLSAYDILKELLIKNFSDVSVFKTLNYGQDGRSILFVTISNIYKVKKNAIELEESHPLGRIFDIDVYDLDGNSIGREAMGLRPRKCILCNGDARICVKTSQHRVEEVLDYINKEIDDYMVNFK